MFRINRFKSIFPFQNLPSPGRAEPAALLPRRRQLCGPEPHVQRKLRVSGESQSRPRRLLVIFILIILFLPSLFSIQTAIRPMLFLLHKKYSKTEITTPY